MKNTFTCTFVLMTLLAGIEAKSQPAISGPTCVVPGTVYEYLINGAWDSTSTMQVCTNSGVILSTTGTCTATGAPQAAVLLTWNVGVSSGQISLSSTQGNASLSVQVTTPLKPGHVITTSKLQSIGFKALASVIHCGADSGGSCSPVYTHQWQQSLDNITWTSVSGGSTADLVIGPVQQQTIFFRRMTVETTSGTIGYSDVASVMVGPPPPGTSVFSSAGANPQ